MTIPPTELALIMSDDLAERLLAIGRTEDIAVSPDGRRLAIARFEAHTIVVLDFVVECQPDGPGPVVLVSSMMELVAPEMAHPHGIGFLSDRRLVVANRDSELLLIDVPGASDGGSTVTVATQRLVGAGHPVAVCSPGSVAVRLGDSGLADVVVCNNYAHTVTRYLVETTGTVEVLDGEVLLAAELVIPDGVAVSRSGEWLAISNHETHEVLMYRYDEYLSPSSLPNGRLSGVNFPHSIRFVGNGSTIIVADAGLPYVHVFTSDDGRWSGNRRPTDSVRVMTDDAFHLGRYNMQEGGPKGIEVLDGSGVLAVTSTHQPLAFFDLHQVVGDFQADPTPPIDPAGLAIRRALLARDRQQSLESAAHAAELADVTDAADRQRADLDSQVAELEQRCAEQRTRIDWLELHIVQTDEAARRHRAEQDGVEMAIRQQLDAIRASTAWRLTAPLRRLKDVLLARRSGDRRRRDDV